MLLQNVILDIFIQINSATLVFVLEVNCKVMFNPNTRIVIFMRRLVVTLPLHVQRPRAFR